MEKRNILVFILLIAIVINIILLIDYIKANGNSNEKTMKCIAQNSKMIISPTCSACAYQKQILGEYPNYFEVISITEQPEVVELYNIIKVPTWIIKGEKYTGVRTIKELKELTGC